jgi:hypothetical protein
MLILQNIELAVTAGSALLSVVMLLLTDASTYQLVKIMGILPRGNDLKLWGKPACQ